MKDLVEVPDEEVLQAIFSIPVHRAGLQFGAPFETVSETSTARSTVGVKAPTNQGVKVLGFYIGFDGTNAANGPAIVEVCSCTWATNPPSTNSTGITLAPLDTHWTETIQSTAAKAWTAGNEPTVLTVQEAFPVPTYMGAAMVFRPLTVLLICKGGNGCVLRITLPSGVTANATGALICEE
jgi:hypothetical protein